jgi:hypothetical protein
MNPTSSTPQSGNGKQTAQAALQPNREVHRSSPLIGDNFAGGRQLSPRRVGYGLPCAECKTYYAADLKACPVCKATQRVSPTAAPATLPVSSSEHLPDTSGLPPDEAALEEERERFLREFKSHVYASHMQINAAASFRCSREENHAGGFEPAAVCQGCYDHALERVDLMEAALHIDLKDAAQVIYDAVWSDPSDPTKTYQNAAHALLTELRKRAGIAAVLGPLKPLPH